MTFPWGGMYDFKLTDDAPYHLDMPFYLSAQVMVMNQSSYDKLSDVNKAVIDDYCNLDWSANVSQGWADADSAARGKMIADETQIMTKPTADEVTAWRQAAEPLIDEWKARVVAKGADADAILQGYLEALDANDAKY